MEEHRISIFISYSHDSESHKANVLSLSDRLITEGIDCEIDRYGEGKSPEKGWAFWMEEKLRLADYVLIVCSETYLKRCEGREVKGTGLGVTFESILLLERLYENGFVNRKFIPVIFSEKDSQFIPNPLKPFTRYNVERDTDYKLLYRRLTNQIEIVKPPLGEIIILPSAVNLSKVVPTISISVKNEKLEIKDSSKRRFDNQFIMIEDQVDLALSFVEHLDISHIVKQVAYINDLSTLSNFVLETDHKRVFWVDINLGLGRENEGLEMIKIIREHSPNSLIIVYSAYADAKEKCLEMGVDSFFLKAGGNYEKTLSQIRERIMSFLSDNEL